MKIVIAPDSFKESLSAPQAAAAIAAGLRAVLPDAGLVLLPLADGGEGTVAALLAATGGTRHELTVRGPLGTPVRAAWGVSGDGECAFVEVAAASGLSLVPPARRNPLLTSSYGSGEVLAAALKSGARKVVIGLGGSATNDGGAGLLQALGARLLADDGTELAPGGGALERLARIDVSALDGRLRDIDLVVACDVDTPLIGPHGASAVFGPQKGATPAMVTQLDANLAHFAAIAARDLGLELARIPGGGAAGGLGAALFALGGRLAPGIELVLDAVGFDAALLDAALVVTGEGSFDAQSLCGKAILGVSRRAACAGVPVAVLAGRVALDAATLHRHGIVRAWAISDPQTPIAAALAAAAVNLETAASRLAAELASGVLHCNGNTNGQR